MRKVLVVIYCCLLLTACSPPPPPEKTDNICAVFHEYPKWYWQAKKTQAKWEVPVSVQMAIIHQESRFNGSAKPKRTKLLWVIPWKRPSSAYGYTQALKTTWEDYQRKTDQKAKRDDFAKASDFIGWYADRANKRASIDKNNPYELYLAYHEGVSGYQQKTYLKKQWLIHVARKVKERAEQFQQQLNGCQKTIKKRWWWF